jgi:hypothetical protein
MKTIFEISQKELDEIWKCYLYSCWIGWSSGHRMGAAYSSN